MANELNIQLDPFNETGLVLLAKVFDKDGTQQGTSVTLTENAPALYSGDFSLASISNDAYLVRFETNLPDELYGTGVLYVRNNAEVSQENFFNSTLDEVITDTASRDASKADVSAIETKSEADSRQLILISEHDQTQSDISNLNDFDPANDDVAKVNLVDVTTTNSDMRGTDNANTVVPDNSGITQIQTDISNLNDVSASDVYAEFTAGTNENAFKADVSGLSTFDPSSDTVTTDTVSRNASKADISNLATQSSVDDIPNDVDAKLTIVHGAGSWQQGSSSGTVDANIVSVDGNNVNGVNDFKADVSGLSTFDASSDDVNTNAASRNASKADVSNLSTFDPSSDDVTTDLASREASKADTTDLATKDNQEVTNDGVKKASLLIPHSDNLPDQ